YITFFYGLLDKSSLTMDYVNAGHNYPIVVRSDGTSQVLKTGGLVLGVIGSAPFEQGSIQLLPGDVLTIYTDGLSELNDPLGEEYGEDRLTRLLTDNRHLSPEAIKNKLMRDATRFALGELGFDDLTLMILKLLKNGNPADDPSDD
ncbi:MAG: serine/threonine-protein phosphatase, partial [Planctomycetes bacterium]|nr:serine/threonine-protein phosphatase [Planctomycetota bacterium]